MRGRMLLVQMTLLFLHHEAAPILDHLVPIQRDNKLQILYECLMSRHRLTLRRIDRASARACETPRNLHVVVASRR